MIDALFDALHRGGLRRHFDADRIGQQLAHQLFDIGRHGGGETQGLALLRGERDDLLDVADEAHIEHSVGLVEHQHLDRVESDMALLDQIEQAARGGDENVDAAHQRIDLRLLADAAEHQGVLQPEMAAIGLETVADLRGQFAGGC